MIERLSEFGKQGAISFLDLFLTGAVAFVLVLIVTKIIHRLFTKGAQGKDAIALTYSEKVIRAVVILIAGFWVISNSSATASLGKILFQGTALIGAVAGFAAQPVISDLFCGLMLSIQKPFELGDRIELEDGTAGIVRDITLRHVVFRAIDTTDIIIPNSRLNAMKIFNMSRGLVKRSFILTMNISYDSNIKIAMEAIREAVMDCPYTVPGKPGESGGEYAPVYFIAYDSSSLVLKTTVYYDPKYPTEAVMSDVNIRVKEALDAKGVEIPYSYVNVVMK